MTISYTAEVATCKRFGCFLKLLLRWRGSIYKLVWADMLLFLIIYYVLNISYRLFMNENSKSTFESIVLYCNNYSSLIPLSFVLGFYVSIIMTRWWDQYMTIPWPDTLAVFVSVHVHGQDERGRVMRRTVMRYVCLCQTIVFTMIAPRVKKRFPNLDFLVDAGLLLENEKLIIQEMSNNFPKHPMHWMPIVWAASIITRARKEGRIRDDLAVKTIIDELNKFRGMCGGLLFYDFINLPLVYTQVVTLAVYTYFICSVMGQQWTAKTPDSNIQSNIIDLYFPIFTTIQFLCYMGWLKVAETLINPWGEDDDDFEVNWIIDRNLQMSYLIVDEMHNEHPELVRDQYWDEIFPPNLPYGNDQNYVRSDPPEPSTAKLDIGKAVSSAKTNSAIPSRQTFISRHTLHHSVNDTDSLLSKFKVQSSGRMHRLIKSSSKPESSINDANDNLQDMSLESESSIRDKSDSEFAEESRTITAKWNVHAVQWPTVHEIFPEETQQQRDMQQDAIQDEKTTESSADKDEFEQLKTQREQERLEKQRQNYARAIRVISSEPESAHASKDSIAASPASATNTEDRSQAKMDKEIQTKKTNAEIMEKTKILLKTENFKSIVKVPAATTQTIDEMRTQEISVQTSFEYIDEIVDSEHGSRTSSHSTESSTSSRSSEI